MVMSDENVSARRPKKLIVYECRGSHPPLGEPEESSFLGIWPEPPFYYLFFEGEAAPVLSCWLERQQGWVLRQSYRLDYDRWQQVSAERIEIGPFVIEMNPGPEHSAERGDGMIIQLDPGLVFGSGLHGSSKGCLLAIARLFGQFPIRNAVDMGTGTGILAISCGLLGASSVVAIDNNPLAARVARKNVLLNGAENCVEVLVADDLSTLKAPSDLLVMNLEWPSLLQQLAGNDWLDYRWVILSGFLESQWDKLKVHISPAFRIQSREIIEDWLTVTLSNCAYEESEWSGATESI
jgi:ribosomal protein L11 methyltransferase